MRQTGIRNLKNNLSRYLRALKAGQALAITDRGRIVAELRSPGSEPGPSGLTSRYAQLIDAGVIRRAPEKGDPLADWPTPAQVRLPRGSVAALINEDRGD